MLLTPLTCVYRCGQFFYFAHISFLVVSDADKAGDDVVMKAGERNSAVSGAIQAWPSAALNGKVTREIRARVPRNDKDGFVGKVGKRETKLILMNSLKMKGNVVIVYLEV